MPFKLRGIGLKFAKNKIVNANLIPEIIDLLSEVEHNRWNVEKLLLGFRPPATGEEHDKFNFIHENICPNAELDEDTKDKDKKLLEYLIEAINREDGIPVRHS